MARENLKIVLAERPDADIEPGKTFAEKREPAPTADDLKDGEILVETLQVSLDPAMRGWIRDTRSYLPPVKIGEVMRSGGTGRVLASKSPKAKVGDLIGASTGWQQYAILKEFTPQSDFPGLKKPEDMLSFLGLTGVTAWIGMTQIGEPKAGETVVVSGAAGATGSVAAQIAKALGARVIGIAGSDDKCKWLTQDLGLDLALNYKDPNFKKDLKEATPDFIDVYFDNVGGDILDTCLSRAKPHARFFECGMISQYNNQGGAAPLKNIMNVVAMRIRMQGFIVFDYPHLFKQARQELSEWAAAGKLKATETIIKGGLEKCESTLKDLYSGINTGKLIVEVKGADEAPSKL